MGVFLGKGKTSLRGKRSFPLPQTPSLFKKSGVLWADIDIDIDIDIALYVLYLEYLTTSPGKS